MLSKKRAWFTVLVFCLLFSATASARDLSVDASSQFSFSSSDFQLSENDTGIFLTAVPGNEIAELSCAGRIFRAGDALPTELLNELTLNACCVTEQTASVQYYTVSDNRITGLNTMQLSILPKKNDPPTAKDGTLQTYKNIENSGKLQASDPENGKLSFQLVQKPKRGTVEIFEDGSFVYTPAKNKVGKDSFTFTVQDDAGNVSEPAKITIEIKKPSDKSLYSDMDGDPDEFKAMWMKDEAIFTGTTVSGNLCFSPEMQVSRGEFVVMVMKLAGYDTETSELSTGFSDESQTAAWLQPYLSAALRTGMISGRQTENGLAFLADEPMTQAEAAVMVQNILQLPVSEATAVFSSEEESTIPVWAQDAAFALSDAGFELHIEGETAPLTRRQAAGLLYQMHSIRDHAHSYRSQ